MTLFTSQSAAVFFDKLFSSLDFTLPRAATGRRGFPKEAMVCAFIVMKCEGFTQITDLMDYLDNNRIIAHYCGFNIMEPLPSYWTYDRFLKKMDNAALKEIMAAQVKKLYEMGIVDASFIGLDSTFLDISTPYNICTVDFYFCGKEGTHLNRRYLTAVTPLPNHVLQVDFVSGSRLLLDMKPYLDKIRFRPLADARVWNSAVTNGIFVRFGDVELSHDEILSMAEQEC